VRTATWLGCWLLLAGLSACGGAAQPAPASSAGDKQIVWYSADADDIAGPVIQAFEKGHPGVKVTHTNEKQQTMYSEIQVQQAAKKVSIDVASTANDVADTIGAHMPASVDWVKLGVPADRVLQDVVEVSGNSIVIVYNTQQVAAADAPKSWDDLLDPKWQGKMAIDGRGSWMPMYLASPQLGGRDKGLEYARKLAAQKPLYQANNSAIEPMVVSGQVPLGTDVLANYLTASKKSPPLEIAPVSPVYEATTFAYVPAGAPHLAAAQLLVAWLGSDDGQAALAAAGSGSLGACDAAQQSATTKALCTRHISYVKLNQLSQFQDVAAYQKQVQQVLGTVTS
jgi:iron(III) transport system substrate-binding protein